MSQKDPSVLLYTQDFLVGTMFFTAAQTGYYIKVLCYQQQSSTGSISIEKIKTILGEDFERDWFVIQEKFEADGNGFFNQRMRKEIEKRKRFSESRRQNRTPKDGTSDKQVIQISSTSVVRMENENENEISIKKVEIIGSEKVKEIANQVWKDQAWREQLCMGLSIKNEDVLKRWMNQFNSSVSQDAIANFNAPSYKKMIRGWISLQQSKGRKIEAEELQPTSNPLSRLVKLSAC